MNHHGSGSSPARGSPVHQTRSSDRGKGSGMERVLTWTGMTAGGWLGWWVGSPVSVMTALILGIVGTGIGLYVGRQIVRNHF